MGAPFNTETKACILLIYPGILLLSAASFPEPHFALPKNLTFLLSFPDENSHALLLGIPDAHEPSFHVEPRQPYL